MRATIKSISFFFFFLFLSFFPVFSQQAEIDSMLRLVHTPKEDTLRIKTLNSIAVPKAKNSTMRSLNHCF
jgi:hypothetical protein